MRPSSKALLEEISSHCSNQLTHYRYNRQLHTTISDKYKKGRITALEYIGELSFYFLQEEKSIQERFREEILDQMKQQSWLSDTEYKQGIYDALNDLLDHIRHYREKCSLSTLED